METLTAEDNFDVDPIKGNDESLETTSTDDEDKSAAEYEDDMREIRTSDDINEPDPEDQDLEPIEQSDPDTIEEDEHLDKE